MSKIRPNYLEAPKWYIVAIFLIKKKKNSVFSLSKIYLTLLNSFHHLILKE